MASRPEWSTVAGRTVRSATALTLLLAALVPHAHADAQSAADRAMLTAWDDSLQQAANPSAIAAEDGPSRHGSGRARELRRALFQVRHADLTDNRGEIELVLTNMQVLARRTNWPWPHYVMARAFEAMARKEWVETLSAGKELAEKHSDAVWRTLRMALDRDESFAPARRLLGELTAAQGDRFLRPDQVTALERESRQPVPNPDALLAWGRHLRTLQDYGAALMAFAQAARRGGDRSRLELERARTLLALGDSAAAVRAYWNGVAQLTAVGREAYRFDLLWIASEDEITAFDQTRDDSVGTWLHRFWGARDAEAANVAGDRLTEQLRRWVVAYARYRALVPWHDAFWSRVEMQFDNARCQHTDAKMFEMLWQMQPSYRGDLRGHEPLLDHRGILYLRHGEPTRNVAGGGPGLIMHPEQLGQGGPVRQAIGPTGALLTWSARQLGDVPDVTTGPATESWLYWFAGDWHILNFRESDALGHYAATTVTQRPPHSITGDPAVASSLPIDEYYALAKRMAEEAGSIWGGAASASQVAHRDAPSCLNEVRAVVARVVQDEHVALVRDSDTPLMELPWHDVVQVFALGHSAEHSGRALVTFAIPGDELVAQPADDGRVSYTLGFRIVAYNPAADRAVVVDTVRRFLANRQLARGEFLTGWTQLTLEGGTWQVASRMWQTEGTIKAYSLNRGVRIDASAGIALSDIVTGRPGTPDWVATDGITFPVNYPNGWFGDETAELFYEVRGIPADAEYHTTMEVRPLDPKDAGLVQLQSTDHSTGAVSYVRKSLGLAQLVPGRYRLVVTVAFGGLKAVREREILIVPRP